MACSFGHASASSCSKVRSLSYLLPHVPSFCFIIMSTFGTLFRVTTYGESHCASVGAIIDGCPPVCEPPALSHNHYSPISDDHQGLQLSAEDVQTQLSRRRPGQSNLTTPVGCNPCLSFITSEVLCLTKIARREGPCTSSIRNRTRRHPRHTDWASRQERGPPPQRLFRDGFVPTPEPCRLYVPPKVRYQS